MSAMAGLNEDAAGLQARVERFQAVRDGILAQVRQVIVGQDEVLDQILIALFVGDGEDADGAHDCADTGADVQAHPVHAGPDAE